MNTRLLGAAVLVALVVLFVPMFFSGKPPSAWPEMSVSLKIPPAPDSVLRTRTIHLLPAGVNDVADPATAMGTHGHPLVAVTPTSGARDVSVTENSVSSQTPEPGSQARGGGAGAPPIKSGHGSSLQLSSATVHKTRLPSASHGEAMAVASSMPTTAGRVDYRLNLSAYSAAGAKRLMQRVSALGFSVSGQKVERAGKTVILVRAGRFATRAGAESARLKIVQSISGVPASLEPVSRSSDEEGPSLPSAHQAKPGAWVVQLAVLTNRADAKSLCDRLRKADFDGFMDKVKVNGQPLWRVRVGPQLRRSDARRLRVQISKKLGISGAVLTVP